MCLTFHEKKTLNFFEGLPLLWPLKKLCLQKWALEHCLWPHLIYFRILFFSKNEDVCKKLELNMLIFDRDMMVLSSVKLSCASELLVFFILSLKLHPCIITLSFSLSLWEENISKIFGKIHLWTKKLYKSASFQVFFYSTRVVWVHIYTRGHKKATLKGAPIKNFETYAGMFV